MNRIKEMLQVAADYIREFCPEQLIAYDETECYGYCVAKDCELAKAELDFQLAQAHRQGWEQCQMGVYQYLKHEEKSATLHQQMAYIKYVADAIAAMEYGGKSNDHL